MKRLAILAALSLTACTPDLSGIPGVVDGDTLKFSSTYVRLAGIDAPELDQTCDYQGKEWACGRAAMLHLWQLTRQPITCEAKGVDRYGRTLAVCGSLNRQMVEDGYAVAYTRYTHDFNKPQLVAMANQAGIWRGQFQQPEAWRRENRR